MRTLVRTLTQITVGPALVALLALTAQAQPPRQTGQIGRARQACDNAAAQAGYRVLRRDRETVNGGSYQLPMHVSHGNNESDLTCSYDAQRGIATVPPWADRNGGYNNGTIGNNGRHAGRNSPERAQRLCENYVNGGRGYQVVSMGTPMQHGQRQWDVPVTVRRNRGGEQSMTCRYNTANGKVSLK